MFGIETIFDSLPQFIIVCLILAAAEAVYVLLGFGAGLIAVGAMALLLPELKDAVVLLLLVNLPAELWVVRSSWKRISWRGVLVIFVGAIGGFMFEGIIGLFLGAVALALGFTFMKVWLEDAV